MLDKSDHPSLVQRASHSDHQLPTILFQKRVILTRGGGVISHMPDCTQVYIIFGGGGDHKVIGLHTHVCTFTCEHMHTHARTHTRTHARTHVSTHACTHTYMYANACTHTRVHARTHTHAHTHIYTYAHMHEHTHTSHRPLSLYVECHRLAG